MFLGNSGPTLPTDAVLCDQYIGVAPFYNACVNCNIENGTAAYQWIFLQVPGTNEMLTICEIEGMYIFSCFSD